MERPQGERGFTLIEVIISLGLMALISIAGFTLLQSVLSARERTQGRLERLGDLQRTMFVITQDFEQITAGPLLTTGQAVVFSRAAAPPASGRIPVAYGLDGDVLQRRLGAAPPQRLVSGVTEIRWRFYAPPEGWRDTWPPAGAPEGAWPKAVAVEVLLTPSAAGPGGALRRIVELPASPAPP